MKIQVKILNKDFYGQTSSNLLSNKLPAFQTPGSVGMDLICTESFTLYPQQRVEISTGVAIWLGGADYDLSANSHVDNALRGYEEMVLSAWIVPRSGLGTQGLVLANTVGIIDNDYQGELLVTAFNNRTPAFKEPERNIIKISAGDRFAQLIIVPVLKPQWNLVDDFNDSTLRGTGGFGSTDIPAKIEEVTNEN